VGSATTAPAAAGEPASSELPAEKPIAKSGAAAASGAARKSEGSHARAKEPTARETTTREVPREPPAAGAGSACRGQLHLYATHGWLLSGGPGSVQAPGRYDWPCGTYGLKAVSRVDPSDVRSLSVTIREGTAGVVDLR
jgi:hypothetical protein